MCKRNIFWLVLLPMLTGCGNVTGNSGEVMQDAAAPVDAKLAYALPSPATEGDISLEGALAGRRSRRDFQDRELSTEQLSQILWAAYGVTEHRPDSPALRGGLRTAPSAGALYPLEIYAVVGNVADVGAGIYRYDSAEHQIVMIVEGDFREELSESALGQAMLKDAPVTVVYSAVFDRVAGRYGERGIERYVYMEVGHSAQNVYLQAEALGLGTCAIGAFTDNGLRELLRLPSEEAPLYLMPVGFVN